MQGEGVAQEREAIARGLESSIVTLQKVTGQNAKEIMAILSLTQYLDTLKSVGITENSKVIFMDTSVSKTKDLMKELIASQEIK